MNHEQMAQLAQQLHQGMLQSAAGMQTLEQQWQQFQDAQPKPLSVFPESKDPQVTQWINSSPADDSIFNTPPLSPPLAFTLNNWLNQRHISRPVYRSSRDGLSFSSFHQHVAGIDNNVCLVILKDSSVIGGYTSLAWRPEELNTADPSAFLFILRDAATPDAPPQQLTQHEAHPYLNLSSSDLAVGFSEINVGPCFGGHEFKVFLDTDGIDWAPGSIYRAPQLLNQQSLLARNLRLCTGAIAELIVFATESNQSS